MTTSPFAATDVAIAELRTDLDAYMAGASRQERARGS